MKKYCFLIVGLVGLGMGEGKGQFNTYHPFPYSNAGWNETLWAYDLGICSDSNGPLGGERYQEYSYYAGGDTIVKGKKYSKLYYSGGFTGTTPCGSNDTECFNNFYCLLRNDTIARKVYVSFNYGLKDTLLYDFSLQLGDTLPNSYIDLRSWGCYISGIDSIQVGTTFRKEYFISNINATNFASIIEGIGSSLGLMENFSESAWDHGYRLNCFVDSTLIFQYNSGWGSCIIFYKCLTTTILAIKNTGASIQVYPNPSNGIFTMVETGHALSPRMEVYNVLGEQIYSASFTVHNSPFTIDLSSKPNGVYFYRVVAEDACLSDRQGSLVGSGKLVVQR